MFSRGHFTIKNKGLLAIFFTSAFLSVHCGSSDNGAMNAHSAVTYQTDLKRQAAEKMLKQAALKAASTPAEDAVVWNLDRTNSQIFSHWLRGNQLGIELNLMRPGLIVPFNDTLFELRDETTEIELCDCNQDKPTPPGQECTKSGETTEGFTLTIANRLTDEETAVFTAPRKTEDLNKYQVTWTPLATVGPYMFIRLEARQSTCKEPFQRSTVEILVLNLPQLKIVDVRDTQEFAQELTSASEQAVKLLNADDVSRTRSIDDLRLVGVEPSYDLLFVLRLHYRFAAEDTIEDVSTSSRTVLSSEITVPAAKIPNALVPYALPPAVVTLFGQSTPRLGHGGWGLISGDEQQRARLFRAFIDSGSDEEER